MKIINYPQYTDQFDCVIHGRILINKNEFERVKKLVASYKPDPAYPWRTRMGLDDIKAMKHNRFCIRVTLTEYVVGKMKHTGKYKRGNYFFEVI